MSLSFGTCDPEGIAGNRAIAQQANAQGITWLASSGDSGSSTVRDPHGIFGSTQGGAASLGLAVGIPASFPEVTAMGGTEFNEGSGQYWSSSNNASGGSAISYIPEMVWNEHGRRRRTARQRRRRQHLFSEAGLADGPRGAG